LRVDSCTNCSPNNKPKGNIFTKKKGSNKKRDEATNSEKLEFIIKRYGKNVFLMSQKERKELDKDIAEAVIKIFKS